MPRCDSGPHHQGAPRSQSTGGQQGPRGSRPTVRSRGGSVERGGRSRTPSAQRRAPGANQARAKDPPTSPEAATSGAQGEIPVVQQGQGEPAEGALQGGPTSQSQQSASSGPQVARPIKKKSKNRNMGWRKELPGILSQGMKAEH